MRAVIPRWRRNRRQRGMSYALSACSLAGRLRRWPEGRLMGGMESINPSQMTLSCRLAPVKQTASGVPRRSATTWRFVPGLPRSVGLGPVCWPPFLPGRWRCPGTRGSNRSGRPRRAGPAGRGGDVPRRPPPANREAAASTSSPRRSPVPAAASPRECRSGAQRRCPSNRRGREGAATRPWVWAAPAATGGRWCLRARLRPMVCSCLRCMHAPFQGFVRGS